MLFLCLRQLLPQKTTDFHSKRRSGKKRKRGPRQINPQKGGVNNNNDNDNTGLPLDEPNLSPRGSFRARFSPALCSCGDFPPRKGPLVGRLACLALHPGHLMGGDGGNTDKNRGGTVIYRIVVAKIIHQSRQKPGRIGGGDKNGEGKKQDTRKKGKKNIERLRTESKKTGETKAPLGRMNAPADGTTLEKNYDNLRYFIPTHTDKSTNLPTPYLKRSLRKHPKHKQTSLPATNTSIDQTIFRTFPTSPIMDLVDRRSYISSIADHFAQGSRFFA